MQLAFDILKDITQPAASLTVIENQDKLKELSSDILTGDNCVVVLQTYEHGLRSYRAFQCWLVVTVLKKQ